MREHLPKLIILVLLALIVGLPILLRPADGRPADNTGERLVIYTPHNEQIRYEIGRGFNRWRQQNGMGPVVIDWRAPGGTSDIRKSILSQYNALLDAGQPLDKGIGADLFFGGGEYDHNKVAQGIDERFNGDEAIKRRIVSDPRIDPVLFAAAFPTATIGGEKLYGTYTFVEADAAGNDQEVTITGWTGVTLSSFGIVYNRDTLASLGIEQPRTWNDLADPDLRGWVALADPGHSGSISATFNTILRREGWAEGWATLRCVFANARYFATSADRVPVDVSRGDAACGMCIDFYGRYQAGAVGGERVGYSDPIEFGKSMTATTADPITLLRGAPSADLARQFIAWLLTPEAQTLWQRGVADRAGNDSGPARPDRYELRRQPIRADLYTPDSQATWVDKDLDPYTAAVPFPEGTPDYFAFVAPVTKAMAIDIHDELARAWDALVAARRSGHANLAQMERLFFAMPGELTPDWPDDELAAHWRAIHHNPSHPRYPEVVDQLAAFNEQLGEIGDLEAKRVAWRSFFQDNYRRVIKLGRE